MGLRRQGDDPDQKEGRWYEATGRLSLVRRKHTFLNDCPKQVFNELHSEVVSRLLVQQCEIYGTRAGPFEVHHVYRLSDLNKPGRSKKPMQINKTGSCCRKTLITCRPCHEELHRDRSGWQQKNR
ncbi:MAG: HNH endonuclease [Ktedonobacteraceae bacterium]